MVFENGAVSREAAAACESAPAAGFTDILVKDAHDQGRNMAPSQFPKEVYFNRGWGAARCLWWRGWIKANTLAFTGYHSPGKSATSPLAHTMNTQALETTLNGKRASEFLLAAYTAGMPGVPVAFIKTLSWVHLFKYSTSTISFTGRLI